MKRTALFVSVGAIVMLLASGAMAKKPLDVDCDVLTSANVCADAILDANNVQFDNLGDLVSVAILDDAVFAQLQSLILFCSGGTIDFDSASQMVTTNAKCGLIPQLIGNIRD